MHIFYLFFILFFVQINSAQDSKTSDFEKEWYIFAEAIKNHDTLTLKKFISDTIFCPSCPYHTLSEQEVIELHNSESYPDTLYQYLAKTAPHVFITDILHKKYDSNVISRLTLDSLIYLELDSEIEQGNSARITIIDQDFENQIEGFQYEFYFEKKEMNYILKSFTTVP